MGQLNRRGFVRTAFAASGLAGTEAAAFVPSGPPRTKFVGIGGGVSLELVLIPSGLFMMGSPADEKDRDDDETQRQVVVSKMFYLGKYPVTQKEWQAVMGGNPSHFQGENLPVEKIGWDDARAFCGLLKLRTGLGFRLPTEAQWEYACRAGATTPFHFGAFLNGMQANCNGNFPYGDTGSGPYLGKTTEVGSYSPNAWGLFDMHGNVWEWCEDTFGEISREQRVLRGGAWSNVARCCRSASRINDVRDCRLRTYGCRVVLPLDD